MPDDVFDYLIVGGGSAGATLAGALAADGRYTIALLEAGPRDDHAAIGDLFRYREVLRGPLTHWLPTVASHGNNPAVRYPQSFVLGGCGSHNSGLWFRPPDSDFLHWERLGARGWGPGGVAPYFEQLEQDVRPEVLEMPGDAIAAIDASVRTAGYRGIPFTHPFDEGYSAYRLSKRGAERRSASKVYLDRIPSNLALFLETPVDRLRLEGRCTIGVSTHRGDFLARKQVILAAGAFFTPKLLMLSGIGPAELLRSLGIAVAHDLPDVGGHFLDHPAATVSFGTRRPIAGLGAWRSSGVLFARIERDAAWPDIEIQPAAEAYDGEEGKVTADGFCCYMTVNRARSEGIVRLKSANPADDLLIEPRFYSDAEGYDIRIMRESVRLARRLFANHGLDGFLGPEIAPGASIAGDAEIDHFVRSTVTTGYHPAGTCAIGRVVGPDLRVLGVDGLSIADASVFPAMVSVNINATCMMIGLKAADLLRQAPGA
jgi:choline dehydrogenase-like flavoprotein